MAKIIISDLYFADKLPFWGPVQTGLSFLRPTTALTYKLPLIVIVAQLKLNRIHKGQKSAMYGFGGPLMHRLRDTVCAQ